MAKFCTKCGSPLEEGQVCSCMAASVVVDNSQQAPVQQPVQQQVAQPVMQPARNVLLEVWNLILNVFRQPFAAASEYVKSNDVLCAVIMILIQGLCTGILVNTVIVRSLGMVNNLMGLTGNKLDTNPGGTIVVGMLVSVALTFAYALLLTLVAMIFKVNCSYVTSMRIMAIRAVAVSAGTVVAIIIALMSAGVAWGIGAIVVPVIGYIYTVAAIRSVFNLTEDKYVYLLMIFFVLSVIVYYVVAIKIGLPNIPLLKDTKDLIGNLGNVFGGAAGMSNLFN